MLMYEPTSKSGPVQFGSIMCDLLSTVVIWGLVESRTIGLTKIVSGEPRSTLMSRYLGSSICTKIPQPNPCILRDLSIRKEFSVRSSWKWFKSFDVIELNWFLVFQGCILSLVHVFFGVQAGTTLLYHQEWKQLISRWLCWGVITGIIGGALCGFSKEDGVIPVNKNMW